MGATWWGTTHSVSQLWRSFRPCPKIWPQPSPQQHQTMAPNLSLSQHEQISNMFSCGFKNTFIAKAVGCKPRAVQRIRRKKACFRTTKAPPTRVGRRPTITPIMRGALLDQLSRRSQMLFREMAEFLYKEFETVVTTSSIKRTLKPSASLLSPSLAHSVNRDHLRHRTARSVLISGTEASS